MLGPDAHGDRGQPHHPLARIQRLRAALRADGPAERPHGAPPGARLACARPAADPARDPAGACRGRADIALCAPFAPTPRRSRGRPPERPGRVADPRHHPAVVPARGGMTMAAATGTSCDTLVVLGSHTRDGHTIFAKNSDRPPTECQPLFTAPRATHPPGATLRTQYLEIPQAPETLAVLGSRPWWLWGFEHGVNECRVGIGNEALHTREEPAETGLLGMDLIRLGLERGRTAAEAKQVITGHLERYGQGGSAAYGGSRRYHNAFIVADPAEAWVIETSGHHWVARRVRGHAAISN